MKKLLLLAWLCIAMPLLVFSQTRQITGTVTDEKGEPLSAVSVVQKGTNTGTVTNDKGVFLSMLQGLPRYLYFLLPAGYHRSWLLATAIPTTLA